MLSFEGIEDCFPENGALCAVDGRVTVSVQWLHDFAHAVAAMEREACAKTCDDIGARYFEKNIDKYTDAALGSGACAEAIRKRSNV